MGQPITTGAIPKLLWPGMNAIWGQSYKDWPRKFEEMFEMNTSGMNYEEDAEVPGFGLAPVKPQGQAIIYDQTQQQTISRYQHVAYALGFIVTHEEMMDNLYEKKGFDGTKALSRSMRHTVENVAANIYNRGFDTAFAGGDGQPLFSASHPTVSGVQSNLLAAADLSEAALEDAVIQIMNAVDARGLKISLMPESLHIATANYFEAERILKSILTPGTGNNAINALKSTGMFPQGAKVNPYLSDADAWFIRTDIDKGMRFFWREKPDFAQDGDFDTSNLKYKAYQRFSAGWTDFRGAYGSAGA
jgi:hypothetical protein